MQRTQRCDIACLHPCSRARTCAWSLPSRVRMTFVDGKMDGDQVLETFSHKDRGAFLRFVWGRSRLPRPSDFTEVFKIHVLPAGDDRCLCVYLRCHVVV